MYICTCIHTYIQPYTGPIHIYAYISVHYVYLYIQRERERETRPAQTRERERKLATGCREIIGLKDGWMDGSVNTVLVHIYLYMGNTYIYICIQTHSNSLYTHSCVRTYVRSQLHTSVHTYTYIHTHIHTYIHTYIHTHIHTLTY